MLLPPSARVRGASRTWERRGAEWRQAAEAGRLPAGRGHDEARGAHRQAAAVPPGPGNGTRTTHLGVLLLITPCSVYYDYSTLYKGRLLSVVHGVSVGTLSCLLFPAPVSY